VSATRNLIVLYGNKCDDSSIDAVAYIDATRAQLIRRAGIRRFTEQIVASR
jgi:hypothetical protein